MKRELTTDYETYREIMSELLSPISARGLDDDTLLRLYKSKLVYLENLRVKCFCEMNGNDASPFSMEDYVLIVEAIGHSQKQMRNLILVAINSNLANRKVV